MYYISKAGGFVYQGKVEMKVLIVALAFAAAAMGIQSIGEPTPQGFNQDLAIIYSDFDHTGTPDTVIALPGHAGKVLNNFMPVGVSEQQNDVLLVRPGNWRTGLLWAWNLNQTAPRLIFDASLWPGIDESPVDYSPSYNENYMAVSDGYHKIWMISLTKQHIVKTINIHALRRKLKLPVGDYPSSGPYIALNPSGKLLAVNLPSAGSMSAINHNRHIAETYVIDLETGVSKYLGEGSPIGWVGDWKVLCKKNGTGATDHNAAIYSVDPVMPETMAHAYKLGLYGEKPLIARRDPGTGPSDAVNWVELWNQDLSLKGRSIPLDRTPLSAGALRIIKISKSTPLFQTQ